MLKVSGESYRLLWLVSVSCRAILFGPTKLVAHSQSADLKRSFCQSICFKFVLYSNRQHFCPTVFQLVSLTIKLSFLWRFRYFRKRFLFSNESKQKCRAQFWMAIRDHSKLSRRVSNKRERERDRFFMQNLAESSIKLESQIESHLIPWCYCLA